MRMAEYAAEQDERDAEDAAWAQYELEQRRQREDAALVRARKSAKELRDIINSTGTRNEREHT